MRLRRIAGQYGIFPNLRGLANTQQSLRSHPALSMTTTLSKSTDTAGKRE